MNPTLPPADSPPAPVAELLLGTATSPADDARGLAYRAWRRRHTADWRVRHDELVDCRRGGVAATPTSTAGGAG